jgi:hypothetical protein
MSTKDFTKKEVAELKEAFSKFDKNGDGKMETKLAVVVMVLSHIAARSNVMWILVPCILSHLHKLLLVRT